MTTKKKRVAHQLFRLNGPSGPETVCGHAVNPGKNPLLIETKPSKITCKNCISSWRRPR